MRKLFVLGLAGILLFVGAAAWLVWHLDGFGPTSAATAASPQPPADQQPLPPAEPAVTTPGGDLPRELEGLAGRAGLASDRDPRNDVQLPVDARGDLLQEERRSRREAAIDLLNRRSARRVAEMSAKGEIRPSAGTPPATEPQKRGQ